MMCLPYGPHCPQRKGRSSPFPTGLYAHKPGQTGLYRLPFSAKYKTNIH